MSEQRLPGTLIPSDLEVDPISPPTPQGTIPPDAQPDAPGAYQPWKGSILPISGSGAPGDWHGDWNAGIIGSMLDAFTLPHDVYTGKQPVYGPRDMGFPSLQGETGSVDPSLVDRSLNLAQFISPRGIQDPSTGALPPGSFGPRAAPGGKELKAAADASYDAARASPLTIPSAPVASYSTSLQQHLLDNFGLTSKTAPKTFDVLNDLANPQNATHNYISLDAARSQLSAIAKTAMGDRDAFAARQAIPRLDNLIGTISPEAKVANANLAAAKRANDITGDLTQANTGILEKGDTAAQLRQRVKTFIQSEDNMRGFTSEEKAALDDFAKGGGVFSTALTKVGNLLGGGLGKVASLVSGTLLGTKYGGEYGSVLGLGGGYATGLIGDALKGWEFSRASNQLNAIGQQLRSRSPLGQEYLNQNLRTPGGLLNRAIPPLTVPFTPQPQPGPPGRYPPLPTTGPIPRGLLDSWA